jgi:Reverse transcriptase (RNA-dependent DNA polymerase)
VGTPQGAVVSPLLANVYLHYVFDLWIEAWRQKVATGDVIVVRYADDLVVGFENRTEAERFLKAFRDRLAKFGLELPSGENTTDRVWAVCRTKSGEAWRSETGDLYVPGFHALLREAKEQRNIHHLAENGEEAHGGEAASPQG